MASIARSLRPVASGSIARRTFTTSRVARDHFLDSDAAVSHPCSDLGKIADKQGFKKRVLDESSAKPILVDFYAA